MLVQDNLIDTTEASRLVGVSPDAIRKWIKRGKIRDRKVKGRWHALWSDQSFGAPEKFHSNKSLLLPAIITSLMNLVDSFMIWSLFGNEMEITA